MDAIKITAIINEKGVKAEIQECTKGSVRKTGIVLGEGNVRPTVYLDKINATGTDEEIAKTIINMYHQNKEVSFEVEGITSREYVYDNCFIAVRRPVEDKAYAKDYLDMQMVVKVKVSDQATYLLTKQMVEKLKITEDIFDIALKHMTFKLRSMSSVLGDMLDDEVADMIPEVGMFMLSTEDRVYGGAAMCDMAFIKTVADKLDGDIVILPSSVHELLVVRYERDTNLKDLNAMVREVNTAEVDPEEQLADHVYLYLRGSDHITMV